MDEVAWYQVELRRILEGGEVTPRTSSAAGCALQAFAELGLDLQEAADRIEALEAENAELKVKIRELEGTIDGLYYDLKEAGERD